MMKEEAEERVSSKRYMKRESKNGTKEMANDESGPWLQHCGLFSVGWLGCEEAKYESNSHMCAPKVASSHLAANKERSEESPRCLSGCARANWNHSLTVVAFAG